MKRFIDLAQSAYNIPKSVQNQPTRVIPRAAFYPAEMASLFLPTINLQVDFLGSAAFGVLA